MEEYPRIAVRAIIINDAGKALILKRANTVYSQDFWNLPGGKVDYGETVEEALSKEILEETGLQISEFSFFTYLDGLPEYNGGPHFITLIFTCKINGSIKLNDESSEYMWIGKEEIQNIEMAFGNETALLRYWTG